MKNRSRLVLIAVAALTMSVAMPSVAFAGEPGVDSGSGVVTVTQEVEIKAEYLNALSSATATYPATGETMTPFAIPPQGGCSWANVSGTFNSSYLNGALVSVDAPYQSSVSCTVTGPDQSMAYMSDIARVYRSGTDVSYGTLGECDEADGPCTFAFSTGEYNCFLYAVCAGIYQISHYPSILLPAGWVWTTYPSSCVLLGNVDLHCQASTNTVQVLSTM